MRRLARREVRVAVVVAFVLACGLAFASSGHANGEDLPNGVPYASDTDPVRIVAVSVSSQSIKRGDHVGAVVITTSNAAAVTAQTGTFRVLLHKQAPGVFEGKQDVPWWAPAGSRLVTFTAIRTDGATAEFILSVDVR